MKIDSPTFLTETTFISSSVVFSSGSQKIGNTDDDQHIVIGNFSGSAKTTGSFGHLTTDSSIGIGTTNVRSALTIKEGVLGGNAEIRFDDTDDTLLGKIGVARTTNEIINGTANLDFAIRLYDQNSDLIIGKGATEVARIDGMNGSYSGSSTSTGSFGHLNLAGDSPGNVTGHLVPSADGTFDLGTTNSQDWRNIYARQIDLSNSQFIAEVGSSIVH